MSFTVHELCDQKGVSLLNLVERTGMDLERLQAIYLGRWTPNPDQRANIAQALNTTSNDIVWHHGIPVEHFYGPC